MTPTELVTTAMQAAGLRDLDAMFDLLSDDVVVEMPFETHGYGVLDKAGFRQVMELVLSLYERFDIQFDRVFELQDGAGVVAEYRSDAVLAGSGVPYRNRYCGVFLVSDGRIRSWREYHDPTVVDRTMAAHAAATS
jgi:ketosteroid isomerase-like protein